MCDVGSPCNRLLIPGEERGEDTFIVTQTISSSSHGVHRLRKQAQFLLQWQKSRTWMIAKSD